jgi:3-methyladenine DNA glycosylase AlkD
MRLKDKPIADSATILTAIGALDVLHLRADPVRAETSSRYFKTGPGGYGAGDRFIGLTAPQLHALARIYHPMPLSEIEKLLLCEIHEARSLALTIMGARYKKGDTAEQDLIFQLYLDRLDRVDNWDLVDSSAPYITGPHLQARDRSLLDTLIASPILWRRRIAILSTLHFIRAGELQPTLDLCDRLIADKQDLMHKACGWMLREVGKRDEAILERWLDDRASRLPRTMLRYAIERMTPEQRRYYMDRKSLT